MSKIFLAQEWMGFVLYGFVVMPDHLHIMIMPAGKYNVSQIMHNIKRNTSRSANIWLPHRYQVGEDDHSYTKMSHNYVGEDDHPRLRKNVTIINMVETKFAWQTSFHDHIIRDERDLFYHLEYINNNPIKHGVVKVGEEYPFMYTDVSYER
jgi:putative transposase